MQMLKQGSKPRGSKRYFSSGVGRAKRVIEQAPFGIVMLDANGIISSGNPAVGRMFGLPSSSLAGRRLSSLLPAFDGRVCADVRVEGLDATGARLDLALTLLPMGSRDAGESVAYLRQWPGALLGERPPETRPNPGAASSFAWGVSGAGRVECVSPEMRDYLGLSLASIGDFEWIEVLHPDDSGRIADSWRHTLESGVRFEDSARIRRADGVYRWFRITGTPLQSDLGQVERWCGVAVDVHDQQSAHSRDASLSVLVDAIPAMLCVTSPDGDVEYVNKLVLDLIGCDLTVFKKFGWKPVIHPDDADALMERWLTAVRTGEPLNAEYRQRYADGSYHWWQCQVKPLKTDTGEVLRWYGVMVDNDERRKTELALRASEQRLRTMVDGVPGMLCMCGPEGSLRYGNQRMRDFIGHGLEDSSGIGWATTIHPDDRVALVSRWTEAVEAAQMLDTEYRGLCSDGTYHWLHVRMMPQFDERGRLDCWYALITDIDDRIQAEEARRKGEVERRRVMESIPIGIWCAAPDGTISFMNQYLADYKGLNLADLQASTYGYIHPDDAALAEQLWRRSVASGEPLMSTHRTWRADGTYRWHLVRAEARHDENGSIIQWYGFEIDIHDYKVAQDDLLLAQASLARASKVATVAELSASIAHEINQPLAAIVANGHACHRWLSAEPPNIEKARLTAGLVVRDGNSAAAIVDRIRGLFKRTAPWKETLDLNQIITDVCELMREEMRRRSVELDALLNRDPLIVRADKIQIQQVVVNLVRNALDAMEFRQDPPKVLSIRSQAEGGDSVVRIRDQGMGMADMDRAFQPFYTTKNSGLGMGLQICRSIIAAHDGQIWAARNEDCGMTFAFRIPLHPRDS